MRDYTQLILLMPIVLFSLVFHEFAHAVTSVRLGDPTPANQGRLTLNPLAHLDPVGTLMIIITMINGVGFGWAKPVRIDAGYYKNPARGCLLVSLAGPLANVTLAVLSALVLRVIFFTDLQRFVVGDLKLAQLILNFLLLGFRLNIALAFFNLLPIPPLDGSRIIRYFLKGRVLNFYSGLERYGFFLLLFVLLVFRNALSSALFFISSYLLQLIVKI